MKKDVPSITIFRIGLKVVRYCVLMFTVMLVSGITGYSQPVLLKPLATGSTNFTTSGGQLYFTSGDSLYTSDGTIAGTVLVKNIGEPVLRISEINFAGNAIFTTRTGSQQSLWKTNGTSAGTVKLATHNTIAPLLIYGSELYLAINNGINGNELWKMTSSDSLSMLKDVNPGSGDGYSGEIVISNNLLYFEATDGTSGNDLWKTDGTTSGTVLAVDLEYDNFYQYTDVNGTIFFTRTFFGEYDSEAELWKTQGTATTTVRVKYFEPAGSYNDLSHFLAFQGKLYFIYNENIPYHHLYVSDGTDAGTQKIKTVTIDGMVYKMLDANTHFVYYGHSQSFTSPIEKSDGTLAGTENVHTFWIYHSENNSDVVELTPTDSLLFFVDDAEDFAPHEDHFQLWQSDLVTGNTKTLKELYNISFRGTDNVTASGKSVFFTTSSSASDLKLWYYNPEAPASCPGTGTILREVWTGVSGPSVSQVPVDTPPTSTQPLSIFEGPSNSGDNYGSRFKGYLCVPQTGSYRFWIASNDHSELWLSTGIDPADKVKIAYVSGATNPRQYNKYASQQSGLINLVAGHLYYIEALHKEGVGTDHVSVGMKLPDGTLERPIPGTRLIPFNNAPLAAITSPENGAVFAEPATVTFHADASDSDGSVVKVEFYRFGSKIGEDLTAPYEFIVSGLQRGDYTFSAKAIDNDGAEGESEYVNIHVRGCVASGTILREVWNGIQGSSVSSIPQNSTPDATSELTIFESPSNVGIHYGSRIRGYICPPQSGAYVFYIASNDNSELWLSTDNNPANKTRIAYVIGSTGIRQWNKYASQRSGTIWLNSNQSYYIEALHKQGVGTDNLAVGWLLPNGGDERPIPGTRLSPFASGAEMMANIADTQTNPAPDKEMKVSLSPNPTGRGIVKVTLEVDGEVEETNNEVNIEIVSAMGRVVFSGQIPCEGNCETIPLDITDKFNPGVYIVNGIVNRKRFSKRLLVQ